MQLGGLFISLMPTALDDLSHAAVLGMVVLAKGKVELASSKWKNVILPKQQGNFLIALL